MTREGDKRVLPMRFNDGGGSLAIGGSEVVVVADIDVKNDGLAGGVE
jgi:hypothetical protein